jgi:hypothetical protein
MAEFTVTKLAFGSYVRLCCLLALHIAALLALFFSVTNDGRQVNFGPLYYDGAAADGMVLAFWLVATSGAIVILGIVAYPLVSVVLKLFGGMKMSGDIR